MLTLNNALQYLFGPYSTEGKEVEAKLPEPVVKNHVTPSTTDSVQSVYLSELFASLFEQPKVDARIYEELRRARLFALDPTQVENINKVELEAVLVDQPLKNANDVDLLEVIVDRQSKNTL